MARRNRSQEDPSVDAAATHNPRSVSQPEMDQAGFSAPAVPQQHSKLKNTEPALVIMLMWWSTILSASNDAVKAHPPIQHHPAKHKSSTGSMVANAQFSDVQHLSELSTDHGNDGGNNDDLVGTACRTPQHPAPTRSPPPRVPTWSSAQSAPGGGCWLTPSTGNTPGSTAGRLCAEAALKRTPRRHSSLATHPAPTPEI